MLTRFYMVYVQGLTSPTRQHLTFEEAKTEAERLARSNHGRNVYVLQALGAAHIPTLTPLWENVAP